ncbi:hypothetical protein ACN38_g12826 [Penicillium nordicum]|uniref:Uncharacterized protein n=1 Tax=Penicillium nordicum TaxID=229535 RepID=A0A0M9W9J3_9EURO|nr:hypothetical protein ACN38_g12826 [Penicillium nordicum]
MDYDKIVSNPQATRYVVNFMHRTGLLQQFQHVKIEEDDDDDEPIGLAAMELGVEDDGGGFTERERERERSKRKVREEWADSTLYNRHLYILSGRDPARRLASSSCFSWMKRLHSHTQLVRLQQVN